MYRRSNLNSLRDTSLKPRWLQSSERSSWFTPTHKLFRSCSGKEGVLWSCKVRLPLWNQQHGPLLGVFCTWYWLSGSISRSWFTLVHTRGHFFLKMLIFICEVKVFGRALGSWLHTVYSNYWILTNVWSSGITYQGLVLLWTKKEHFPKQSQGTDGHIWLG